MERSSGLGLALPPLLRRHRGFLLRSSVIVGAGHSAHRRCLDPRSVLKGSALHWGFTPRTSAVATAQHAQANKRLPVCSTGAQLVSSRQIITDARQHFWEQKNTKKKNVFQVYELLQAGQLADALQLYRQLPDNFTASALLSELGNANDRSPQKRIDVAFKVYDRLIASGQKPTSVVINALIMACRRCGQPGRVVSKALDDMKQYDVAPSEMTFHLLAAAAAEARDFRAAKRLLQMQIDGGYFPPPNSVDCGQLLKALLHSEDVGEGIKEALVLLQHMRQEWSIELEGPIFTLLLQAYGTFGNLQLAQQLYAHIPPRLMGSVLPGIIQMFASCGAIDESITAYKTSLSHGFVPRMEIIAVLVNTCRKVNQPGKVLPWIFSDIDRFGVDIDDPSLGLLAAACGDAKHRESARILIDKIRQGKVRQMPHVKYCGQLAKALAADGSKEGFHEAISLLNLMDEWGVVPSDILYCQLLTYCIRHGDLETGKHIHERICRENALTTETVRSLILMYIGGGSLENAETVFNSYRLASNHSMSLPIYTAMVNGYAQYQCGLEALDLFNKMLKEGPLPDNTIATAVLLGLSRRHPNEAQSFYESIVAGRFPSITPHPKHLHTIVRGLCQKERYSDAWQMVNNAITKHGITPYNDTWMFLRDASYRAGDTERTEEATRQLNALQPAKGGYQN